MELQNILKFLSLKVNSKRRRARASARDHLESIRDIVATEANKQAGIFDSEWYTAKNPDVAASGQDPLYHYLNYGHSEGRDPGPNFSTNFYYDTYPDVVINQLNPLFDYVHSGRAKGRAPNPRALAEERARAQVRHIVAKELAFKQGAEAAVLITHAPSGRLKPHVLPYMHMLRNNGLAVLLVAAVDRPLELLETEIAAANGIIVRDNAGYDFGALAHCLQLEPALYGAGLLVITNDSVVPNADTAVFAAMIGRVRACPADIVGLTASHEYGWHIQSYFLALKPRALSSLTLHDFVRDIRRLDDKDEVIRAYEVPFAARMQAGGLSVEAIFTCQYSANPTFFGWRELIEQGFPFIKLLMLRAQFAQVTDQHDILQEIIKNWPEVLGKAGFDVDLVRAAVRATDISSVPAGPDTALLVNAGQFEAIGADHPPKVAFFGPWNYESGLGTASRELLCALRRAQIKLNAYAIEKPFHVHRQVCPPAAQLDFAGRPDIAVVHVNPDSWHLLTDEQMEIIRSAKQRIGYWVWETDTIPPNWEPCLHAVDRIWAPSRYCADVFAAAVNVPVDVVPHPVRVPTHIAFDRATSLRRLGIDPDQRTILYIFDGASYVIRKNPEALVRAFVTSGLALHGWTLILKTKHLYDRPGSGEALTALAAAAQGVRLIEVSLHTDEVTSLLAAVDIYASPHCSEGFGLTVAEAMALGKPVIATDYAGTRDFLDSRCGYPVAATPWVLAEDDGHYLAGHGWAKINEDALASTLLKVAALITAGGTTRGVAAKAVIEQRLSYESVVCAITASFAAVIADSAEPSDNLRPAQGRQPVEVPIPPEVTVDPKAGQMFRTLEPADGVVPMPLSDDLAWNGDLLPDGDANDWLFFAPGGAKVCHDVVHCVLTAAKRRPDVVLFYADDVAAGEPALNRIRLKPEFDRTLLASQDYIGAPIIVRRKTLLAIGGLDLSKGNAVLYDLVSRIAEIGGSIGRIPQILLSYQGRRPVADIDMRRLALAARRRSDNVEFVDGEVAGLLIQRRCFADGGYPPVTIAVPTRRACRRNTNESYIECLLAGIAKADWPMDRLTVIVGDDVVGEADWAHERWPFRLTRIETPRASDEAFNYAAKMNALWRTANDEHIIFLNDDVVPERSDWLQALVGFASDESVGGVGGRLYYGNGSLQHAGIFPAFGTVVHAWLGWPATVSTYQDWALAQREWSMVTGAVFATRRSILEQVNGLDEKFSLEFNDIDLCLRIRNLGYRIVYNPDAQFTHVEKGSRGETVPPGSEVALFQSRWSRWLENDPAWHPGFVRDRFDPVPHWDVNAWFS
jgi:glycosyltransferase involved in cell wall biosynthesis